LHKVCQIAQAGHQGFESAEFEGVGPVRQGSRGIVMHFQEYAAHSCRHSRASQGLNVLGLAAAAVPLTAGKLE